MRTKWTSVVGASLLTGTACVEFGQRESLSVSIEDPLPSGPVTAPSLVPETVIWGGSLLLHNPTLVFLNFGHAFVYSV